MQRSLCVSLEEGKSKSKKGENVEDLCDHSYCQIRRQKKQTGCVDLPPKGLPWSTGLLKYLPGQRQFWKDLYLKQQLEEEAAKLLKESQTKKKPYRRKIQQTRFEEEDCQEDMTTTYTCFCCPLNGNGNGKGKKKKGKGKKRPNGKNGNCMICTCIPDDECDNGQSNEPPPQQNNCKPACCVELEEVIICDGCSEPRRGYLFRPCQRPDVEEAADIANDAMKGRQDEIAEKGMICLCIPRVYLERYKGTQDVTEDICAKYGFPMDKPPDVNGDKDNEKTDQQLPAAQS